MKCSCGFVIAGLLCVVVLGEVVSRANGQEPAATLSTPGAERIDDAPEESAANGSENIEELIKATEDPDWKSRWDAVNALGTLRDPKGTPALVKRALHDDNPHPRWRSLWALTAVDAEGTEAVPLLKAGLQSSDPVVVRNAAVALAMFGRPEARPELLRGLKDSDTYRRWEAVFSLRKVGDPNVTAALIPLLDENREPNRRVRGEVTLVLGRIGDKDVVPPLVNTLRSDQSPEVRWRAALALSRLGDASLVDELQQALRVEDNSRARKQLEEAIKRLQKPSR